MEQITKHIYRDLPSLDAFKLEIDKLYTGPEIYKPYLLGTGGGFIHLLRIRLGLSGLNHQRFSHNLISNAKCDNCNCGQECEVHFLLECPAYTAARTKLIGQVLLLLPQHQLLLTNINNQRGRRKIAKLIIYGCQDIKTDIQLFTVAALFIEQTERFS